MKPLLSVITAAVVLAIGSPASAPPVQAAEPSAVRPWIELELRAIASHTTNPVRASRALAHLSGAMYSAALSGSQGREDAVAGAASTVLLHFYPDEADGIDSLADQLADLDSAAFARGRVAGRLLVAARANGRLRRRLDGPPSNRTRLLGAHAARQHLPAARAACRNVANLEPARGFAISSRATARIREPPVSRRAPRGVWRLAELDPEQKRIAEFWADGAGTVTPPGHWNQIALEMLRGAGWSSPAREPAVLGAEHGPGRRFHRLLGRQVQPTGACAP